MQSLKVFNGVLLRFALDVENAASEWDVLLFRRSRQRTAAVNRTWGNEPRKSETCSCWRGRRIMENPANSPLWGSIRPLQSRRTGFQTGSQSPRCKDRRCVGIPLGRSLPVGRYVAEPGGSSPEKRPEALGDGKKQRLLSSAEEERPRRVDGQVHRWGKGRGYRCKQEGGERVATIEQSGSKQQQR